MMMAVTPLHVSSEQGHVDIVNYLIPQGGDVNRKDDNEGRQHSIWQQGRDTWKS